MRWLLDRLASGWKPADTPAHRDEVQPAGPALSATGASHTAELVKMTSSAGTPAQHSQAIPARGCHDSADSFERPQSCLASIENDPLQGHPRYKKLLDLNSGSSGFVQLVEDLRTGEHVAVKFIRWQGGFNARAVARELLNQRLAQHPRIVQLQEAFLTQDHLAIAMEYADGGNVSQYIDDLKRQGVRGMPEDLARWILQQLLVALDYCHRLGIANRDVKLDNVLLHGPWPRPCVKLCDFGFSVQAAASKSNPTCGTPEYMAPEVLFEDSYDAATADIWSCGVSLYVMLTGDFPFKRPNDKLVPRPVATQRMFSRIYKGEYPVPLQVSAAARELLSRMLQPNVHVRATLAEVFASRWVQENMPPSLAHLNGQLAAAAPGGVAGSRCRQSPQELLDVVTSAALAAVQASPGTSAGL